MYINLSPSGKVTAFGEGGDFYYGKKNVMFTTGLVLNFQWNNKWKNVKVTMPRANQFIMRTVNLFYQG